MRFAVSISRGPPEMGNDNFPGSAIDLDALEPGRAVRAYLEMKIVVAGESDFGAAGKIILKQKRKRFRSAFLAQFIAKRPIAAFGHGLRCP